MGDTLPPDEPYLSSYLRVQRGIETAQDLIDAFPALEQAVLNSSSTSEGAGPGLTEQDRRRILDLPEPEEEAANIRRATTRSRAELVYTALSSPGDLSDAELKLLKDRFWADITFQEVGTVFSGKANASTTIKERLDRVYNAASELAPLESLAYKKAVSEFYSRRQRRQDERTTVRLSARQRHTTPAWMHDLARQLQEQNLGFGRWGFIALYDAEVQETTSVERLDKFEFTVRGILRAAMMNNGAEATALAWRWRLHFFNAPRRPSTANSTTADGQPSSPDEPEGNYHTTIRNAFRAMLDSPECTNMLRMDQAVRTDMFLVINKECIDSVLGTFLDDMYIRAYEADFPPANGSPTADDGYEG
ncbi:hypothetical protein BR93DRAFT_994229 [Coniochaeta sp. PMI_546]|nr:hypothetical protein BR93DRAFT_994229 [Coniochaeta sp. PMI_546]